MPTFITYGSYSQSGVKGLVEKPVDRTPIIKALVEKAGGKLIGDPRRRRCLRRPRWSGCRCHRHGRGCKRVAFTSRDRSRVDGSAIQRRGGESVKNCGGVHATREIGHLR